MFESNDPTRVMSDPEGLSINTPSRGYRRALWAALVAFSILLLVVVNIYSADENTTQDQSGAETAMCDKYAAVDGSDDAEGTKAAPFRTPQRLVDSLSAGQVGCLRGGVYTDGDKQVVFNHGGTQAGRITLQSLPGETAEFRGSVDIPEGSNYVTVRNMHLDGSYGAVGEGHPKYSKGDRNTAQAIRVMGDNVNVHHNDITNRRPNGNPDLAGTCIILGSSRITAANTSIKGNRIHRCGQMPPTNHEHGVYASNATGAKIIDNLFYDNADRGIQLYPDSKGVLVEGNVVDGNGQGLIINAKSSYNTVRNNVFSNPADSWNVNLGPELSGRGNRVSDNCFWAPGGNRKFEYGGNNTSASGNITANPHYQNRDSFKITNSTCLSKYSGTLAR
jgi:parallel beta-helix repeat protein